MNKTSVAVLGTLADFHREPIPYNLGALLRLVKDLQPDLLHLDITKEEWATQDFAGLPPEYREALLPLAQQTDIVVVPIADERPNPEPVLRGVRAAIGGRVRRALAYLQRSAPSAASINQGLRHHLANHLGNANNLVLFIGYCADHTLGAQILAGKNPVNIFGEPHVVRAKVKSFDAFSGHADRHELKRYVERLTGDLKKIAVIHGEETQCLAFAETLRSLKPKSEVLVPESQQALEL